MCVLSKSARASGPRRTVAAALLATALCVAPAPAYEVPVGLGRLQVHGFFTQAWLRTSDNRFFGSSDDASGTVDARDVALNGSWRLHPKLMLAAQGISRWAGEADDGAPRLDYGFLDVTPVITEFTTAGVRLGRVFTSVGFYNQDRDTAFTRPSILLPQSIYFDRTRDLSLSGDGGTLYAERRTDLGIFQLEFGAGYARVLNEEVEYGLFGLDAPGELDAELSWNARLLYDRNNGQTRLAVSTAHVPLDYDPDGPRDPILSADLAFHPWIFSAQQRFGRVTLTGEYALRFFDVDVEALAIVNGAPVIVGGQPLVINRQDQFTGESFYLQGTYRFLDHWEALVRYDVLYADRSDRDGSDYEDEFGAPAHTRYAKDWTLGLRWDVTHWWMLRAEYHNVDGTGWVPRVDNPDVGDLSRRWHLFGVLTSLRF